MFRMRNKIFPTIVKFDRKMNQSEVTGNGNK